MKPKQKEHKHKLTNVEKSLLVHGYSTNRKVKGAATARDKLKQRQCKCGFLETYDLERTVI